MVRVIHTADTHIGYRQYHAEARREDFLAAFERVVDDAIEADVDAVIHAGDLFHDKRPDLRDIQGTVAALAKLRVADIPFLGIVGNHERKRDTQWLDLIEDIGLATRLSTAPTMVEDVAVYGLDYATPAHRDEHDVDFESPPDAAAAALVGHGMIEGLPHGDWPIDDLLQHASVSFDAVLLGDYHGHVVEHRDDAVITYPGSTERASAEEVDPRGYNVVTFADEGVTVTHRALEATRPFVYVDVNLAAHEGEDVVIERLAEYDIANAVVIVSIDGDGEPVTPAAVETAAIDAGALVCRVRDRREAIADAGEIAVSFGDPDQAVRAALADEAFSKAALEIDDVVRDLEVPDSHVRDRVHDRLRELVDDPAALERPETVGDETHEAIQTSEADADYNGETASEETSDEDDASAGERPETEARPHATSQEGQASMEDYL